MGLVALCWVNVEPRWGLCLAMMEASKCCSVSCCDSWPFPWDDTGLCWAPCWAYFGSCSHAILGNLAAIAVFSKNGVFHFLDQICTGKRWKLGQNQPNRKFRQWFGPGPNMQRFFWAVHIGFVFHLCQFTFRPWHMLDDVDILGLLSICIGPMLSPCGAYIAPCWVMWGPVHVGPSWGPCCLPILRKKCVEKRFPRTKKGNLHSCMLQLVLK